MINESDWIRSRQLWAPGAQLMLMPDVPGIGTNLHTAGQEEEEEEDLTTDQGLNSPVVRGLSPVPPFGPLWTFHFLL